MGFTEEDARYSWLYANGYPEGPVERLVDFVGGEITRCARILDAGCGRQGFARVMQRNHYEGIVIGLDASRYLTETAPHYCPIMHAPLDNIPVPDKWFDGIFCCDVLEHIPQEQVKFSLTELRRVLQNEGVFAFSIGTSPSGWKGPNGENLHPTIQSAAWWISSLQQAGFTLIKKQQVVQGGVLCYGHAASPEAST